MRAPPEFRREGYRIRKKVQLCGFADMDEVMAVLKLHNADFRAHGRIIRMPGSKEAGRSPIWTKAGGLDVVQLWELLCNDGKAYDIFGKPPVEVQDDD